MSRNYSNEFNQLIDNGTKKDIISFLVNNDKYEPTLLAKFKLFERHPDTYEQFFDEQIELSGSLFDQVVASKYLQKAQNAAERGLDFTLTLTSFKNMMRARKCYYTGRALDFTTLTIERLDHKVGYVANNCCACHKDINRLKASVEGKDNLSYRDLYLVGNKLKKLGIV